MVKRVSAKPKVKTHFLPVETQGKSVVAFWFEIDARGIQFSSKPLPALASEVGQTPRFVGDRPFWDEETLAEFWLVGQTIKELVAVGKTSSGTFAEAGIKAANDLAALENKMATAEFMAFFNKMVIPLSCHDPADERSFAFYRGTVWSCSRDLNPEQWRILVDSYVAREEADLAQALGLLPQPENREAIPTQFAGRCGCVTMAAARDAAAESAWSMTISSRFQGAAVTLSGTSNCCANPAIEPSRMQSYESRAWVAWYSACHKSLESHFAPRDISTVLCFAIRASSGEGGRDQNRKKAIAADKRR
ncbi:MAG: hypothetical protein ABSG03_03380 [Bryobacteraceae bacterium]|jgi:hypothetical protein